MRRHHCHARGCTTRTAPRLLMCPHHWRMIPPALQAAVWQEYRRGQAAYPDSPKPALGAIHAAITLVAKQEGHR